MERPKRAIEELRAAPDPDWATIAIVEAITGVANAVSGVRRELEEIDQRLVDLESAYAKRPNP